MSRAIEDITRSDRIQRSESNQTSTSPATKDTKLNPSRGSMCRREPSQPCKFPQKSPMSCTRSISAQLPFGAQQDAPKTYHRSGTSQTADTGDGTIDMGTSSAAIDRRRRKSGNIWRPFALLALAFIGFAHAFVFSNPAEAFQIQQEQRGDREGSSTQVDALRELQQAAIANNVQPREENLWPKSVDGETTNERFRRSSGHYDVEQAARSAEMPAEFRDAEQAPKEQSRLAKLCQQTSSVLASVLPAPFGGHKRSILCQFFGQVQVPSGVRNEDEKMARPVGQFPIGGVSALPAHLQQQFVNSIAANEAESITILHQQQEAPMALAAAGKHPIQMVLEHQQRQAAALASMQPVKRPMVTPVIRNSYQRHQIQLNNYHVPDLRAVPSSGGQTQQQNQRNPPKKFSAPLVVTPPAQQRPILVGLASSSSPAGSSTTSSGWHIFNATFLAPGASSKPVQDSDQVATSSMSPPLLKSVTQQSSGTNEDAMVNSTTTDQSGLKNSSTVDLGVVKILQTSHHRPKTLLLGATSGNQTSGLRQLRIGKQAVEVRAQQKQNVTSTTTVTTTISTTTKQPQMLEAGGKEPARVASSSDGLRTIEVMSQSASAPSSSYVAIASPNERLSQQAAPANQTKPAAGLAPSSDPRQVQKREELVIASINNLTRIAFGNQLRDTMKVISKLIDQQADLFSKPAAGASANQIDPMLTSDSIGHNTFMAPQQIVGDKLTAIKPRKKEQPPAKQSTNSNNKVKATHPLSEPKSRHKQIGAAPSSTTKRTTTTPGDKRHTSDKKKVEVPSIESIAVRGRKAAGHADGKSTTSQRGLRFSQSIPTSPTTRARHSGSPLAVQPFELKRLTTVSRALTLPGDQRRQPKKGLTRSAQRVRVDSDLDANLAQASTRNELVRETTKASAWFPSSGPMTKHSTTGSSKLAKTKTYISSSDNGPSSTTPVMKVASANVVTQFPWLVPDKSVLNGDLFSAASSSPSEGKLTYGLDKSSDRSLTTRRLFTPYAAGQDVTNKGIASRVEHHTRPDSLTTLKMAVAHANIASSSTQTTATITTPSPPQQYVAVRSTRLPFSNGAQSRWIPSTMFVTRPPSGPVPTRSISKAISLRTMSITTSTTSTTTTPSPTTTTQKLREQKDKEISQATINELRASDSISRYTTHLSGEASELMATTRNHFQHPMPQIANTGDFFSAETIASWPDKYHTMISQAPFDTSAVDQDSRFKSTASFTETTRRNGDSFDLIADSSSTSFASSLPPSLNPTAGIAGLITNARHKFDNEQYGGSNGPRETTVLLSNITGITILPANHKLTPTVSLSESSSDVTGELTSFTSPMQKKQVIERDQHQIATTALPTIYAFASTRQVSPYTLIRSQVTQSGAEFGGASNMGPDSDKQPDTGSRPEFNASLPNESLRPPYLDAYGNQEQVATDSDIQLSDATLVLDPSQNRPHVSRKLHELLVPSTQNFVVQQNPLNAQRFNWSALKYLAQNLLSGGRFGNDTSDLSKSHQHLSFVDEVAIFNDTKSENANKTQQSLYDLILKNGFPSNYKDMFKLTGNNGNSTTDSYDEKGGARNDTQAKGIFERAGSLLHDLKQLEQRKAAAILAAFRYQVPGPLVRPWDIVSDYQSQSAQGRPQELTISRFLNDRLDAADNNLHSFGKERQMSTSQLIGAIKSTLFKQKFIARDELEARLNAGRRASIDQESNEHEEPFPIYNSNLTNTRRSDSDVELKEVFSKHSGRAADSVRKAPEFSSSGRSESASERYNSSLPTNNLFEEMLLEPLGLVNSTALSDETGVQRDFDAINLSEELEQKQIHPIYLSKNQLRGKSKLLGEEVISQKSASNKSLREATYREAPIGDRLKSKTTIHGAASEMVGTSFESTNNFDCTGKGSGFYPDARSSCRSFYHCSDTGHLLTFECPTQTRFDERSLKCGPWYEVRCDTLRERRGI